MDSNDDRRTLRCTVRYDGGAFSGWQIQPNARTVQGVIEESLSTIASEQIRIHGAGRTDAGVHALGQVFHFAWPAQTEFGKLPNAIAGMSRGDILITTIDEAPDGFHSRFDAKSKRYGYTITLGDLTDPLLTRYAFLVPRQTDLNVIKKACQQFVGVHDFAGFQCAGADVQSTEREIFSIEIFEGPVIGPIDARDTYRIVFHGNGFLYKMVRNLVGTCVDIARGRLSADIVEERLHSAGPYDGFTAPGHGLCLMEVNY